MPSDMTFRSIGGFRIVTTDLVRLAGFYRALGFEIGEPEPISTEHMQFLGLAGRGSRIAMVLGPSHVDLVCFEHPGHSYPDDATACDLVFQHLALVTDDTDAAWRRARNAGASLISRQKSVTLPPSDGGVTAVKFRDPDGHPLEFLQFPPGTNPDWGGTGIMGIDHSAISVSNPAASRLFYFDHGLSEGAVTFNRGLPQDELDGLDGVEVDVMPMLATHTPPHLEMLGYRHPVGRAFPLAPNDVAATRIVWQSDSAGMIRDPDGHLHELTRRDLLRTDSSSR